MDSCFTLLVLSAHNPHCEYTYTPRDSNLWVYACANTHTHTRAHKKYTLRRTAEEVISADKKTFRRYEKELREAASFSFLCKLPSHTLSFQGGMSPLP